MGRKTERPTAVLRRRTFAWFVSYGFPIFAAANAGMICCQCCIEAPKFCSAQFYSPRLPTHEGLFFCADLLRTAVGAGKKGRLGWNRHGLGGLIGNRWLILETGALRKNAELDD